MSVDRLLIFLLSLIAANFLMQWLGKGDYRRAVDLSSFQIVTVILFYVFVIP